MGILISPYDAALQEILSEVPPHSARSEPYYSYLGYAMLSWPLSFCILFLLFLSYYFIRHFDPLPIIFTVMFKVEKRRLYCFDLDVTLSRHGKTIRLACQWIVWVSIVTLSCYFWQTVILYSSTLTNDVDHSLVVTRLCYAGFDCFQHNNLIDIAFFWRYGKQSLFWVCDRNSTGIVQMGGFLTCDGVLPFESLNLVTQLAITTAFHHFLIMAFQLLVWMIYRSNRRWILYGVLILAILAYIYFVVASFIPEIFGSGSWFSVVTFLAFPVILTCGFVAARALQDLRIENLAKYRKAINEPLQLEEESNRKMEKEELDKLVSAPNSMVEILPSADNEFNFKRQYERLRRRRKRKTEGEPNNYSPHLTSRLKLSVQKSPFASFLKRTSSTASQAPDEASRGMTNLVDPIVEEVEELSQNRNSSTQQAST